MDFYLESIQQLPAIVERGPAEKENITRTFNEFVDLAHLYESAIEVVKTYLGILDSEFSIKYQRNPIHYIKSRLKSAESTSLRRRTCRSRQKMPEKTCSISRG